MRVGLFNDTSVSGHIGCTAVMATLLDEVRLRGAAPAWLWPVATPWQAHAHWLDRQGVDAIMVNGEGTLHHSAERQRTRDLLALPRYAQGRGVPIHLVNASVSAMDAAGIEALRTFTTIHVREGESQNYLASHGIASEVVADLSLGASLPTPNGLRRGIFVTDCVLRETAEALRRFANVAGARHERMQRPRFGRPLATVRRMLDRLRPAPGRCVWRPRSNPHDFMRRLQGAELVVTGRFHTVLLCLLSNTPVLALSSNTRKIEAVMLDCLGHQKRMIRPEALEGSDAAARLLALAPYSAAESEALACYREHARQGRNRMFDSLLCRGN